MENGEDWVLELLEMKHKQMLSSQIQLINAGRNPVSIDFVRLLFDAFQLFGKDTRKKKFFFLI